MSIDGAPNGYQMNEGIADRAEKRDHPLDNLRKKVRTYSSRKFSGTFSSTIRT